ncbi:MAG: rRNA maturation RNase YbeY [Candidatus Binatus sp.]|uniref:rRNA maturation RNase YbeY n=1 Tax=Candidatus Binatus sp. TaxID=2811406 RepID=UPI003D13E36C
MAVEFRCATARGRCYARGLRADADHLMRAVGLADCELSLTLTSDRVIRRLNRDFRGIDAATDVLSFSQIEQAGAAPLDPRSVKNSPGLPVGDVVISIDTAIRDAREFRVSPASRLRRLLIHGFLHLIGYDHERSASDARRMFARERTLAVKIGEGGVVGSRRTPGDRRKPKTAGRRESPR